MRSWERRLKLGPTVAVVLALHRYPYGNGQSRWIFRPSVIVDRAFGGSGTCEQRQRPARVSGSDTQGGAS